MKRAPDIINRINNNRNQTVLRDYPTLFGDGAHVYITYFQIDKVASKYDNGLDSTEEIVNMFKSVNSDVGVNTPYNYNKIEQVPLYNVDTLNLQTSINERGIQTEISSQATFIPDTVVPVPGEFFIFDIEGFKEHIFQISDVQISNTGPLKFYNVEYTLYQAPASIIEDNVSDNLVLVYENIGSEEKSVIKKSTSIQAEEAQKVVDELIDDYIIRYYDEETNVFRLKRDNDILWSGFLQHFMCRTSAIKKYDEKLLEAIYLLDFNNFENELMYDEEKYRESIFRAVEKCSTKELTFDSSFIVISEDTNLKVRSLPFIYSSESYKLIRHGEGKRNAENIMRGFPFIVGGEDKAFSNVSQYHSFVNPSELNDGDAERHIEKGDVIYQYPNDNTIYPSDMFYINKKSTAISCSIVDMLSKELKDEYEDLFVFNIIKKYIHKELVLDDELLEEIRDFYPKKSIYNYLLLPLMIYILKEKIKENFN